MHPVHYVRPLLCSCKSCKRATRRRLYPVNEVPCLCDNISPMICLVAVAQFPLSPSLCSKSGGNSRNCLNFCNVSLLSICVLNRYSISNRMTPREKMSWSGCAVWWNLSWAGLYSSVPTARSGRAICLSVACTLDASTPSSSGDFALDAWYCSALEVTLSGCSKLTNPKSPMQISRLIDLSGNGASLWHAGQAKGFIDPAID